MSHTLWGRGGGGNRENKPTVCNDATYISLPMAMCAWKNTRQHGNIEGAGERVIFTFFVLFLYHFSVSQE